MKRLYNYYTAFILILIFIEGCSQHNTSKAYTYKFIQDKKSFYEKGIASWYGDECNEQRTASGEIYDKYAMTAAHKTLPFGTMVKVKNLENNKEIEVKINDRGPFVRLRIIDLSYKAAKILDIDKTGIANVLLTFNSSFDKGLFSIQVGAFTEIDNAEKLKVRLDKKYKYAHIVNLYNAKKIFYRVRVGKFTNLNQAREGEKALINVGFKDSFTIAEEED